MLVVSLLYWGAQAVFAVVPLVNPAAVFALGPTFTATPWTLVTSVYAHANVAHLVGNAVTLLFVGLLLERSTTNTRFHLFVLVTGILAGLAQVFSGSLLGQSSFVLGTSGAIFALIGYVVTANPVSEVAFSRLRLTRGVQFVVFAVLAVAVTILTGAPGVALVAHFTGLLLGLVAGRLHVLEPSTPRGSRSTTEEHRL
jgi:membrane associated rhomboid family serine protease